MSGLAPYRSAIAAQETRLRDNGFSWLGEDRDAVRFTDGEIALTFSVQPHEDALEVWVRHLGEQAPDEEFRVDLVMRVMHSASTQDFITWGQAGPAELVGQLVGFVIDNKQRLFGPLCPYGSAYEDYNRQVMAQLMAQWAHKP